MTTPLDAHRPASRTALVGAFAALYVVWGSTYLGSKFAMASVPPALLSAVRFAIAGVAMAAIGFALGKVRASDFGRIRWWRNGAIAGALLFAVANVLVSSGVQRIPSGIAALIVGLTSVWIVLFDRAITKAGAPPWTIVLGLVCGLAGVAILGGPGWSAASAALDTTGVMLVVASTVAWACGTMVAKHSERSPSLWAASVMQMLGGSAAAFVVAAILERDRWPTWEAVTPGSLWAIAYLVVFGSLIGFTAYVFLLQHCSAQAVATYAYVNPLVALVLGAVLAGERVPARTGLAAPLILGAVALLQFVRPPSPGEPPIEEE